MSASGDDVGKDCCETSKDNERGYESQGGVEEELNGLSHATLSRLATQAMMAW
jgi:hypothetical protein